MALTRFNVNVLRQARSLSENPMMLPFCGLVPLYNSHSDSKSMQASTVLRSNTPALQHLSCSRAGKPLSFCISSLQQSGTSRTLAYLCWIDAPLPHSCRPIHATSTVHLPCALLSNSVRTIVLLRCRAAALSSLHNCALLRNRASETHRSPTLENARYRTTDQSCFQAITI